MDWINSLNNAISYIEEHILEDISYEEVARKVFSSSFHFHRAFSLLTQMTLGEYIRRNNFVQHTLYEVIRKG